MMALSSPASWLFPLFAGLAACPAPLPAEPPAQPAEIVELPLPPTITAPVVATPNLEPD